MKRCPGIGLGAQQYFMCTYPARPSAWTTTASEIFCRKTTWRVFSLGPNRGETSIPAKRERLSLLYPALHSQFSASTSYTAGQRDQIQYGTGDQEKGFSVNCNKPALTIRLGACKKCSPGIKVCGIVFSSTLSQKTKPCKAARPELSSFSPVSSLKSNFGWGRGLPSGSAAEWLYRVGEREEGARTKAQNRFKPGMKGPEGFDCFFIRQDG